MSLLVYPCAACKIQRRKCGDKCLLAPYFPPNNPRKFLLVSKIFGISRIVRILKDIPTDKRADAVTSLVYEASARVVDPIYGCTGAICRLQKQVLELQSQLATTQADLLNARANLVPLMTGFHNASEIGSTILDVRNVGQHNDDIIVLQDELDLAGWEDMIFPL